MNDDAISEQEYISLKTLLNEDDVLCSNEEFLEYEPEEYLNEGWVVVE